MTNVQTKDRYGLPYSELLAIQEAELAKWKAVLTPEAYQSTRCVLEVANTCACEATRGLHIVPRGHELARLIQDFPRHETLVQELMLG